MEGSRKDSPRFTHPDSTFLPMAGWPLLQRSPPGTPRTWPWSVDSLRKTLNLWNCNAKPQVLELSASAMMARRWFILSTTRSLRTSGSSLSTVRREDRSLTSNRNSGSKLGLVRGHTDSDVVLLQESRP